MRRSNCPSPDLLAGFVDGGLLPEEIELLDAHLRACAACRARETELRGLDFSSPRTSEPTPRRPRLLLAASVIAASILAAFVAYRILRTEPGTDERLESLVARLTASDPRLFAGVSTTGDDARGIAGEATRGVPPSHLLYPPPAIDGLIVESRPTFRFRSWAGEDRHRVRVFESDGTEILSAEARGGSLAFPDGAAALEPGRHYLWEVRPDSDDVGAPEIGEFTVADAATRDRFEARRAAVREAAGDDAVALILVARIARSERLYAEALAAARRFAERAPNDPAGRLALELALREANLDAASGLADSE